MSATNPNSRFTSTLRGVHLDAAVALALGFQLQGEGKDAVWAMQGQSSHFKVNGLSGVEDGAPFNPSSDDVLALGFMSVAGVKARSIGSSQWLAILADGRTGAVGSDQITTGLMGIVEQRFGLTVELPAAIGQLDVMAARHMDAGIDDDAVGEWVGEHYRVNYDALGVNARDGWRDRYAESHGIFVGQSFESVTVAAPTVDAPKVDMGGQVVISVEALRALVAMSNTQVEDVRSGLQEGLYEASENQDFEGNKAAVKAAEAALDLQAKQDPEAQNFVVHVALKRPDGKTMLADRALSWMNSCLNVNTNNIAASVTFPGVPKAVKALDEESSPSP